MHSSAAIKMVPTDVKATELLHPQGGSPKVSQRLSLQVASLFPPPASGVSVKENMPPLPWGVGGGGGMSADVIRGENAKEKG